MDKIRPWALDFRCLGVDSELLLCIYIVERRVS